MLTYGPMHVELNDLIGVMTKEIQEGSAALMAGTARLNSFVAGRDALWALTDPASFPKPPVDPQAYEGTASIDNSIRTVTTEEIHE